MSEQRLDPNELLRMIEAENKNSNRGKLKIFFGYAAGVGKTYAMLQAAQIARQNGVDVVAGYIEPHTRPETTALLKGLEALPSKMVEHKGINLKEFDLDAAIQRKPKLILVDELAHTNAPGSRHKKRYQDIEELLNLGIHVYTTINVQHIESLNDIIANITHVTVQERIPDHFFDDAHQIEFVDIEPEELIQRLNQGKVYRERQAKNALDNFFSLDNLTALREIALRRTADHINRFKEKIPTVQLNNPSYFTSEHILICLSSSPTNAKVIRTAARMRDAFKGHFTALFVETSKFKEMSEKDYKQLRSNLKLAEQLGAKIVTVYGDDIPYQIAEYARIAQVSKIILGRSNTKKRYFFSKPSFTEQIRELVPNMDIYIIPDNVDTQYIEKRKTKLFRKTTISIKDIVTSIAILIVTTIIGFGFHIIGFSEANIIIIYILGVLITALLTSSKWYCITASLVSVFTFNFFFTIPRFSFNAYDPGYPITFIIMFIAAFITGTITMKMKEQTRIAARKSYRTEVLLETSQKLQQAEDRNTIIWETAKQIVKLLDRSIVFYPAYDNKLEEPQLFNPLNVNIDAASCIDNDEKAVAQWVYKNNKRAGASTNTLPSSKCLYLAIRGASKVYAVVGVVLAEDELESFEYSLLISMLSESSLAFEKEDNNELKKKNAIQVQQEQLRANLLRSISHDLRTPLTSISGNAGILLSNPVALDDTKKLQLYSDIYDDSMWLINLVENLLSVTRLEDGSVHLQMESELLDEVFREALLHINRKQDEHTIQIQLDDDLLMAKIDSHLIIQVIINIVNNAIKYTPQGSIITLSAYEQQDKVMVSITDDGVGISDNDKDNLFEMFYTAKNGSGDSRRGLGLGLALCKSIIHAHGGTIDVRDNLPHGCIFTFTLPKSEVEIHGESTYSSR